MDCHGSAENIGKLLNTRHMFFIPFTQDNPITKPRSLVFNPKYILDTIVKALEREQIQPILFWKRYWKIKNYRL